MGWLYGWNTKQDLVKEILTDHHSVERASLRGSTLWTIERVPTDVQGEHAGKAVICCYLLRREGGDWGYKDMDETAHPYYYDCPLSFLGAASPPINEDSRRWRELVREHHARAALRRGRLTGLAEGMDIRLVDGCIPSHVTVTRVYPRFVSGERNGVRYKVNKKHIAEIIQ